MTQVALSSANLQPTVAFQENIHAKATKAYDFLHASGGFTLCCQQQRDMLQQALLQAKQTPTHENGEELARVAGNVVLSAEQDDKQLQDHARAITKLAQTLSQKGVSDNKPTPQELLALGATLPTASAHVAFVCTFETNTGLTLGVCKRLRTYLFNLRQAYETGRTSEPRLCVPSIRELAKNPDFQLLFALAHALAFADRLQKQRLRSEEKLSILRRIHHMVQA